MRRLILCADGTWCTRDQIDRESGTRHPTNVTKLARAVVPQSPDGTSQIVYYHAGIGTYGPLDHLTGGAFGDGMGTNVQDLYRFLVYNYAPGDEIYLFGFSRGAFTVRTLAGFMNRFGLVQKGDDYSVPDLYHCYESNAAVDSDDWRNAYRNVRVPRPCPPIKFIGVWDTVGALGAPGFLGQLCNKNKYQFHDVGLNPNIQNAFHALALDERREPFTPTFWTRPQGWTGSLVQAWFSGTHGNIGGGNHTDGLANEALHWMVEKAEACGLVVDDAFLQYYTPCYNSLLRESMNPAYKLLGDKPRPVGQAREHGESVHQSAWDRISDANCSYHPANLMGSPLLPIENTHRIKRGSPCPPTALP